MIYSNEKVRITPFERSKHMSEEYRSWFNNPEVTKFNSHGLFPYSSGAMEAFIRTIEQGSDSKIVWAIEIAEKIGGGFGMSFPNAPQPIEINWQHIGNVSLQSINWINRSAELAIVLGRERRHGYGHQACEWAVRHAFMKLGLHRVWTGTAATNIGMQRVCEKLGMKEEGVFRDAMFLNGRHVNVLAFGIIARDYNFSTED